ncbi:hypothetical protein O9K51_09031 [Purpureocillium lavendulum]|uniref:Uncharacterized protein n=1 Tax=Purpureocillium lavendulum TaxID=1247861 RepID=A0AB34FIB5_9HYPO|nr:hypothetical protein O9K51_09031 [Purpureocillium lavendulum]
MPFGGLARYTPLRSSSIWSSTDDSHHSDKDGASDAGIDLSSIALKSIPSDDQLKSIENFKEWEVTLSLNLRALGLHEHLEGVAQRPVFGAAEQKKFDDAQAATLCYIWNAIHFKVKQALIRSGWTTNSSPKDTMSAITEVVLPKGAVPGMLISLRNYKEDPFCGTSAADVLEEINKSCTLIKHHVRDIPKGFFAAVVMKFVEECQPAISKELQERVKSGNPPSDAEVNTFLHAIAVIDEYAGYCDLDGADWPTTEEFSVKDLCEDLGLNFLLAPAKPANSKAIKQENKDD